LEHYQMKTTRKAPSAERRRIGISQRFPRGLTICIASVRTYKSNSLRDQLSNLEATGTPND
jgi:hypothetical protein